MTLPRAFEVAVPLPLHQTYTYLLPDTIETPPTAGCRVKVPFAGRTLIGFVTSEGVVTEKLKSIQSVLDDIPILSQDLLHLAKEMSRHYFCGIGEALSTFLPAAVKKGTKARVVTILTANPEGAKDALLQLADSPRAAMQHRVL